MPRRDGKSEGLGTGFVVSADEPDRHQLPRHREGRAIAVELADGTKYEATAVYASDRGGDLAVVRIDAKDLTPLELADSDKLKDGQAVVALGNPRGLKYSGGGRRAVEPPRDRRPPMLQVAIPIEPGNSGGPLLDRQGRVVGIMTAKSLVTENLASRWPPTACGTCWPAEHGADQGLADHRRARPGRVGIVGGASWRQRAGRISVEGPARLGGRSQCLSSRKTPELRSRWQSSSS